MKKLLTIIIILFLTLSCSKEQSFLDNYTNKKFIASDDIMLIFYRAPIMATKKLTTNENKQIEKKNMLPTKIGYIDANNITIYKENNIDSIIFSFKKVSYYRIKPTNNDSFTIAYIKASHNKELYEIIIELKDPIRDERIMYICKKGIPITIISYPDYFFNYSKRFNNSI